ncbi:MAG: dihydrodipicolinate synthase family protein [Lentisphaeria bacterium]|nr:dihydrodipicolinate synthase family protein [Lentisphaeria bacterium]
MKITVFSKGVWPVLLTPFKSDCSIDFSGFASLLEYYIAHRVSGLFAVCLSSEMFQLSSKERLELAKFTVKQANSRVPVVACAGFGDTLQERIDSVKAMAETGVDAVVLPLGLIVSPDDSEAVLEKTFDAILNATGDTVLGLYECPVPYHRLLSADCLGRLAKNSGNRLSFLKDTCCNRAMLSAKLEAIRGTELKLYNANLPTYLYSLQHGAAGYSGTSANFYPEILAELTETFQTQPERAQKIQDFLTLVQRHVDYKYPNSAKKFLSMRGVAIEAYTRMGWNTLNADDLETLSVFDSALQDFVVRI